MQASSTVKGIGHGPYLHDGGVFVAGRGPKNTKGWFLGFMTAILLLPCVVAIVFEAFRILLVATVSTGTIPTQTFRDCFHDHTGHGTRAEARIPKETRLPTRLYYSSLVFLPNGIFYYTHSI
jgi:hypothetical protein